MSRARFIASREERRDHILYLLEQTDSNEFDSYVQAQSNSDWKQSPSLQIALEINKTVQIRRDELMNTFVSQGTSEVYVIDSTLSTLSLKPNVDPTLAESIAWSALRMVENTPKLKKKIVKGAFEKINWKPFEGNQNAVLDELLEGKLTHTRFVSTVNKQRKIGIKLLEEYLAKLIVCTLNNNNNNPFRIFICKSEVYDPRILLLIVHLAWSPKPDYEGIKNKYDPIDWYETDTPNQICVVGSRFLFLDQTSRTEIEECIKYQFESAKIVWSDPTLQNPIFTSEDWKYAEENSQFMMDFWNSHFSSFRKLFVEHRDIISITMGAKNKQFSIVLIIQCIIRKKGSRPFPTEIDGWPILTYVSPRFQPTMGVAHSSPEAQETKTIRWGSGIYSSNTKKFATLGGMLHGPDGNYYGISTGHAFDIGDQITLLEQTSGFGKTLPDSKGLRSVDIPTGGNEHETRFITIQNLGRVGLNYQGRVDEKSMQVKNKCESTRHFVDVSLIELTSQPVDCVSVHERSANAFASISGKVSDLNQVRIGSKGFYAGLRHCIVRGYFSPCLLSCGYDSLLHKLDVNIREITFESDMDPNDGIVQHGLGIFWHAFDLISGEASRFDGDSGSIMYLEDTGDAVGIVQSINDKTSALLICSLRVTLDMIQNYHFKQYPKQPFQILNRNF